MEKENEDGRDDKQFLEIIRHHLEDIETQVVKAQPKLKKIGRSNWELAQNIALHMLASMIFSFLPTEEEKHEEIIVSTLEEVGENIKRIIDKYKERESHE